MTGMCDCSLMAATAWAMPLAVLISIAFISGLCLCVRSLLFWVSNRHLLLASILFSFRWWPLELLALRIQNCSVSLSVGTIGARILLPRNILRFLWRVWSCAIFVFHSFRDCSWEILSSIIAIIASFLWHLRTSNCSSLARLIKVILMIQLRKLLINLRSMLIYCWFIRVVLLNFLLQTWIGIRGRVIVVIVVPLEIVSGDLSGSKILLGVYWLRGYLRTLTRILHHPFLRQSSICFDYDFCSSSCSP
jgi:hypothetical protein